MFNVQEILRHKYTNEYKFGAYYASTYVNYLLIRKMMSEETHDIDAYDEEYEFRLDYPKTGGICY